MEPRNVNHEDQGRRSDSPPSGERASDEDAPRAGGRTAAADAPAGDSVPVNISSLRGEPGRTTVIKTGAIRQPGEGFDQRMMLVPIESAPPGRPEADDDRADRAERDRGEASRDHTGQDRNSGKAQSDSTHQKPGNHNHGGPVHPAQQPSLMRTLLYTGAVALVCGVAGAWAYSHFLGGSKSGDQGASGKNSGSGKGSGSNESSESGKDSESGQGSDAGSATGAGQATDTSPKGPARGELVESQKAWLAAIKELQDAKSAEKDARHAEQEAKIILDFFRRTLLSAGRTGDVPLSETFWAGGPGKDLTLRKALDATDPQVSQEFSDRPLVEASIREMLGLGYLNVGEPKHAVDEYRRALTLRESVQGPNQPDAASCRNQLAVAYRLAGMATEAGRLFDRNPNSPAEASALAARGSMLLNQKKPAEAELAFRQCLSIREKILADDWSTFDARSSLGESLLDQGHFADAEPMLLSGYEGMSQREHAIPTPERARLTRALERLVRLYDAWGKQDDATKWRKKLAAAGTRVSRST
jgi:tetratricopeptide (TPR) repeat protein